MIDLHSFAYAILLITLLASMAFGPRVFGIFVVLFAIATGLNYELITVICAGISVFLILNFLKS